MTVTKKTRIRNPDQAVYFDCDDTLVMWGDTGAEPGDNALLFDAGSLGGVWLVPHKDHISLLKQHWARGHTIIVWSAGGEGWAREVVRVLRLKRYVDVIVAKPTYYYDDLVEPRDILGLRRYIEQENPKC